MTDIGNSLKVLHLNSLLNPGGTDDQCVRLVQGLRTFGVDARIAGPAGREFSRKINELGLPFHVTPPEKLLKRRFILASARIIRQEQIQIVHGHHGRDIWPTILAARLSGVHPRIVLTRHLAKSPSSWPSRRLMLGQVDALVACSRFVKRVLSQGHYEPDSPVSERRSRPPLIGDRSKIHMIYGGIDTHRFKPMDASALRAEWGVSPENFIFAMVGGYPLPSGKGQREFLRAAERIHAQIPHARFLIVGHGSMADVLRADIEQLKLKGKAWLTPYCDDMPSAMNAIDCLVHSQIGTEAMPGVVCEAQACGRPVIASDMDGIPEAFHFNGEGRLVVPGSIEQLAEALSWQARQPHLPDARRAEMHARITDSFSLDRSARDYRALYQTLSGDPERGRA